MIPVEEILRLPRSERIELVKIILDSIADEAENSSITPEQLLELKERRKKYEEGNMPVYSWQDIKEDFHPRDKDLST